MGKFDGKVVVIAGGKSGIGLAAQRFIAEGARAVVTVFGHVTPPAARIDREESLIQHKSGTE